MEYTKEIQDLADQFAREQEQEYEFIAATFLGAKDDVLLCQGC